MQMNPFHTDCGTRQTLFVALPVLKVIDGDCALFLAQPGSAGWGL